MQRISQMRLWRRRGVRAPHKPLLLLYALGRLQNDRTSRVNFEHSEPHLKKLIQEFGPPRANYRPEHPFGRLVNDGLWKLTSRESADTESADTESADTATSREPPSRKQLVESGAVGQFHERDEQSLLTDPQLLYVTARKLLADNWPNSLHADICSRVGLTLEAIEEELARLQFGMPGPVERTGRPAGAMAAAALPAIGADAPDAADPTQGRRRDLNFRERVLRAYEYRCAMCRWDGRLDNTTVGLEAAQVRWFKHDGPDEPRNGLSLCVMHHKLFDLGVLGLTVGRRISVSQHFFARGPTAKAVVSLVGQEIESPQVPEHRVDPSHIEWHQREVFRSPARKSSDLPAASDLPPARPLGDRL